MAYTCPCCGYPALREPPRLPNGGGSYEICPSCGFQFGVSDDDEGFTFATWRARWKAQGTPWSSKGIPRSVGWDAEAQLKNLKAAGRKTTAKPAARTPRQPRR